MYAYSPQGFIQGGGGGGGDLGYPPKSISPQKNPFSIDIIWHFPGGTCPQTPLGVKSLPPQPKILYESLVLYCICTCVLYVYKYVCM